MPRPIVLLALLVTWLLAGCRVETPIPEGSIIECGPAGECPDGLKCSPDGYCRDVLMQKTEPKVALVSPRSGEAGVGRTVRPMVIFSMPVTADSVKPRLHLLLGAGEVAASVESSPDLPTLFTVVPEAPLRLEAEYTLVVDPGVAPTDTVHSQLSSSEFRSTFRTDLGLSPVAGLVVEKLSEVRTRVSWRRDGAASVGALVLRSQGAAVEASPAPGHRYSPGDLLGNATVVTATDALAVVDDAPSPGTWDYAVFAYNVDSDYSEPRRAPLVTSLTTQTCSGTGQVKAESPDSGSYLAQFTGPASSSSPTTATFPPTPTILGQAADTSAAQLLAGETYLLQIVAVGTGGTRREAPVPYVPLSDSLAPLALPVVRSNPAQPVVIQFPMRGWPKIEFEIDGDPLGGTETWTSDPGWTTTSGSLSATFRSAGKYRVRARGQKAGCPSPGWTVSDEFDVGRALFVAAATGDDAAANPGTDPAHPLKSLARATALAAGSTAAAPTDVYVAAGSYAESLFLPVYTAFFGSWAQDFRSRADPRDPSVVASATSRVVPWSNVGITTYNGSNGAGARVDGFFVEPQVTTGYCYGLYNIGGLFTVTRNVLHGGRCARTSGLQLASGAPNSAVITDNVVDDGAGSGDSYGLEALNNSGTVIARNDVTGVVGIDVGQGSATVEGNTVHLKVSGGNGNERIGIFCGGDASIRGNLITGNGLSTAASTGILAAYVNGNGRIEGNRVFGGGGTTSVGIRIAALGAQVVNNLVHGGIGGESIGILADASYMTWRMPISNNTVFAGHGANARVGIELRQTSLAGLSNNLVFGEGTWVAYRRPGPAWPRAWQNDAILISAAPAAILRDSSVSPAIDSSDLAALTTALCTGPKSPTGSLQTIDLAPSAVFTSVGGADGDLDTMGDNDWSLATSDPRLAAGGRDTSFFNCGASVSGCPGTSNVSCGDVSADFAGTSRTVPFSVGAFEKDP